MSTPTSSTSLADALGAHELSFPTALEALRHDHVRHRALCVWIESDWPDLDGDARRRDAQNLFDFLTRQLPQHEQDEHEELFPVLIDRCLPADNVEGLLARLADDHAFDDEIIDFVIDDLTALAAGRDTPNPQRLAINLSGFASRLANHIGWENETILPLLEARLTADDQARIAERMAQRRLSSPRSPASGAC